MLNAKLQKRIRDFNSKTRRDMIKSDKRREGRVGKEKWW
jgi:hypothetical protein